MATPFFINLEKEFSDRYDIGKFFEYTDNVDVLTSTFVSMLPSLGYSSTYLVQGEDERPDLICKAINVPQHYWYIIMLYNNKFEFSDIKTGDVLLIPDQSQVDDLFFSLKSKETARSA